MQAVVDVDVPHQGVSVLQEVPLWPLEKCWQRRRQCDSVSVHTAAAHQQFGDTVAVAADGRIGRWIAQQSPQLQQQSSNGHQVFYLELRRRNADAGANAITYQAEATASVVVYGRLLEDTGDDIGVLGTRGECAATDALVVPGWVVDALASSSSSSSSWKSPPSESKDETVLLVDICVRGEQELPLCTRVRLRPSTAEFLHLAAILGPVAILRKALAGKYHCFQAPGVACAVQIADLQCTLTAVDLHPVVGVVGARIPAELELLDVDFAPPPETEQRIGLRGVRPRRLLQSESCSKPAQDTISTDTTQSPATSPSPQWQGHQVQQSQKHSQLQAREIGTLPITASVGECSTPSTGTTISTGTASARTYSTASISTTTTTLLSTSPLSLDEETSVTTIGSILECPCCGHSIPAANVELHSAHCVRRRQTGIDS